MKKFFILLLLMFCTVFLCGCPIVTEWDYALGNDYLISYWNSNKIICVKQTDENSYSRIVDDYVAKFCYNSEFVCLECIKAPEDISEELDFSNPEFYIANMKTDQVFGPYTDSQYEMQLTQLHIINLCDWIDTTPMPDDATLPIDEIVPKDAPLIIQVFCFLKFLLNGILGSVI